MSMAAYFSGEISLDPMMIARSVIHPRFVDVSRVPARRAVREGRDAVQVDQGVFRATLGCFPTGVAIVTSLDGDVPVGMVVGSFSSISLDPPLVGFFADLKSSTFRGIQRGGRFVVNVLGAEHEQMCRRFFRDREARFQGSEWITTESGLPKFAGAIAWIDCAVEQEVELGDHMLVVGRVEALGRNPDKDASPALVFHRGAFAVSGAENPGAQSKP
nr:FMN-binding type flavin reductase-like protein [uncultured bacterium]